MTAVTRVVPQMTPEEERLRRTKTVVLNKGTVAEKRAEIKDYLVRTMDVFEKLYGLLACEEAFQMQPLHKLRHPHIFYYGHTASFFINKLVLGGFTTRINPLFEEMFAIGVDEMQWDDLSSAHYDFPSSSEVLQYRNQVRERMLQYIADVEFTVPITWESPMWPIVMGIEHERIHLETSAVLIRELPISLVKPDPFWRACPHVEGTGPAENPLVAVPEAQTVVGRPPVVTADGSDSVYGWDCDHGQVKKEVAGFKASKYLVSNHEFHSFMAAGGYSADRYWTEEGLGWRNFRQVSRPHFWVATGEAAAPYKLRLLAEEIEMPWSWPAEVNNHEAKAFCNWKAEATGRKIRLPTEAEWNVLYDMNVGIDHWQCAASPGNSNLEKFTSPCPVDMFKQGDFYDVIGNVWQHTETPMGPLEGFQVHPLYDDFSMPTFDGDHAIQKGGCWIATGNEATRDARFAFRRHFYQMIGIRFVEGDDVDEYAGFYAADPVVDQYTEFHYGKGSTDNFPVAIARFCADLAREHPSLSKKLALDLGCRSGRTSLELARTFEEVQGVDFSARYIMPGCQMRECQQTKWEVTKSGDLVEKCQVQAADLGLDGSVHNTTFWQADPCNMHKHLTGYSFVLANINLLERCTDPRACLHELSKRTSDGAFLVVACTYDWKSFGLADKKDRWLSGFTTEDGREVSDLEGLRKELEPAFSFVKETTLPYRLPLTTTRGIVGDCHVTVWKKN
ncbi:Hercynine oxygenase [Diplonema papillatum]|nr:Hercynine oxygenase [Diplonema papillatum]